MKTKKDEMILQGIVKNSLFLLYTLNVALDFILAHNPWSGTVRNIKNQFRVELVTQIRQGLLIPIRPQVSG